MTSAIGCQRPVPIGVSHRFAQTLNVLRKTRRHPRRGPQVHGCPQIESGIDHIPQFINL